MYIYEGFPGGSVVKNLPSNAGDMGLITGLGRSSVEENGYPLQYSYWGNPMDRGAWWVMVYAVAKSQTRLTTQAQQTHKEQTDVHTASSLLTINY